MSASPGFDSRPMHPFDFSVRLTLLMSRMNAWRVFWVCCDMFVLVACGGDLRFFGRRVVPRDCRARMDAALELMAELAKSVLQAVRVCSLDYHPAKRKRSSRCRFSIVRIWIFCPRRQQLPYPFDAGCVHHLLIWILNIAPRAADQLECDSGTGA
jgi:hypothetical protein